MKKSLLVAVASFSVLSFASTQSANAQELITQEEVSTAEQELREIQQKYNIEEVDINKIPEEHIIKFDSVEDLEVFIKELQLVESEEVVNPSNFSTISQDQFVNSLVAAAATKYYDDSAKMDWYSPFTGWGATSLLQFKRITFDYKYYYAGKVKRFKADSITNIVSEIYGVSAWTWTQSGKGKSKISNTPSASSATIETDGFYTLGVSLNGFTIGAKLPGTIKRTYDLS